MAPARSCSWRRNFSGDDVAVDLPLDGDWSAAEVVLANLPEPGGPAGLVLRPWESVVWRRATG